MAKLVRVATVSILPPFPRGNTDEVVEKNLRRGLELISQAALDKADVVCLPEGFPTLGLSIKDAVEKADEVASCVLDAVKDVASTYDIHIVCPLFMREEERVYNSAVFIDRKGKLAAVYRKVYPTIGEIEAGVTPGEKPVVHEADYGKTGFAICFDLNFRELFDAMKYKGAKLVFFPSMYPGGLQLSIRAFEGGFYMASAYTGEGSCIVDPLGRVLTVSSSYSPVIVKTVNLDFEILHIDYNYVKWRELKRKYGPNVEIEVRRPEAVFMLTSYLPDKTVAEIMEEFGLETREEYFERSRRKRRESLSQRTR